MVRPDDKGQWLLYADVGPEFPLIGTFPSREDAEFLQAAFERQGRLSLHLNEYQAVNLRWLLALIHDNKHREALEQNISLDSGDWCGELRWQIEQLLIDHDVVHQPNVSNYWPTLLGWHNGRKSAPPQV